MADGFGLLAEAWPDECKHGRVLDTESHATLMASCPDCTRAARLSTLADLVAEFPAEAAQAFIKSGVLVRLECLECDDRGQVYYEADWPEDCHLCDGGRHPSYGLVLPTEETTSG